MNVFHRVAQRSMRANRMRTIVTIIGVILSAAMFTAVTTFATTLLTHLQRVTAYLDGAYYLGVHNVDADTLASMRARRSRQYVEYECRYHCRGNSESVVGSV